MALRTTLESYSTKTSASLILSSLIGTSLSLMLLASSFSRNKEKTFVLIFAKNVRSQV